MKVLRSRLLAWAVFVAVLGGLWLLATLLTEAPARVLPSPLAVVEALLRELRAPAFWGALGASLQRVVLGFVLATVLGTLLGAGMARLRPVDQTLGVVFLGLQAVPTVGWVPLGLLWFGQTAAAVYFTILVGAVGVVALTVDAGVKRLAADARDAGDPAGGNGLLLGRMMLPIAAPDLVTAVRLGWAWSWRALISAELLVQVPGLARGMVEAQTADNGARLFALMGIVMLVGASIDNLCLRRLAPVLRRRAIDPRPRSG